MPYSEAQKKASRKYNEANYDRLYITIEKGKKDIIKKKAELEGISVNEFVVKSIEKNL